MAVYHERPDPMSSISASLGSAAGSGASSIMDMLTNTMQNAPGFEAAGFSPQQAKAFAGMRDQQALGQLLQMLRQQQGMQQRQAMQQQIMQGRQDLEMQKQGLTPGQPKTNKRMQRIMANKNLAGKSRKIKEYISKGKALPDNLFKFLKAKKGLTDESLMMLTSDKKLTEDKAKIIMRWANGDVEKARNLARRWGFDIPLADYEESDVKELLQQ